jgi:hypothetical protein
MVERTDNKREIEPKQGDGSRAPWQRPALVRLDANEAEFGDTMAADAKAFRS